MPPDLFVLDLARALAWPAVVALAFVLAFRARGNRR